MTTMNASPKALFVALCLGGLALYPLAAGDYGMDLVTKIMIYAIFALSLELLVGTTGLVCFGHAAFFGIGAYAAVLLAPESAPGQLAWLLPACPVTNRSYSLSTGFGYPIRPPRRRIVENWGKRPVSSLCG